MLNISEFRHVCCLLRRELHFNVIERKTGVSIPLICAISRGWTPFLSTDNPAEKWSEHTPPTQGCSKMCDTCRRGSTYFLQNSKQNFDIISLNLRPEDNRRYLEIRERRLQKLAEEDWKARCFPE